MAELGRIIHDPVEFVNLSREVTHHPELEQALRAAVMASGGKMNAFEIMAAYAGVEPDKEYYYEKDLRELCVQIEKKLYHMRTGIVVQ